MQTASDGCRNETEAGNGSRKCLSNQAERAGVNLARETIAGYSEGPNTDSILVFSVAALKGFTM
jgi:hypothetical protein